MPEQYGFGDYATEPTRLCQSNKGGDQMNQKDDEVAHCGNDIKTRQALDFGPLLEFAMNRPGRHRLAFDRFPGFACYTTYLAPPISRWGEDGFSSCSTCPCHRAVPTTPPK